MTSNILLLDIFYYFVATAISVPLFKALRLGSVLGYLFGGIVLGPSGLSLLHHTENIKDFSQAGIIILLFVIGLELSPARLKHMQKSILGLGVFQFIATVLILFPFAKVMDLSNLAALIVAISLSFSSTAYALSYLKNTNQLTKSFGQSSFSILIFQDLIIIPLMVLIPILSVNSGQSVDVSLVAIAKNVGIVIGIFLFGKYALGPTLNLVHKSESKEIFIGTCLTVIIGSSLLMEEAGLSKALGAFIAGIFLSDSNLKRQIQDFSVTLKSMLIGVFFMGIGLDFNLVFFKKNIFNVVMITTSFMSLKFIILAWIGKVSHGNWRSGAKIGAVLSQGGEFGFLLLGMATSTALFNEMQNSLILTSITLSIFIAPFISKLSEILSISQKKVETEQITKEEEEKYTDNNIIEFPQGFNTDSIEKKFGT